MPDTSIDPGFDPILLEVFKNRFASIAEEMGMVLRRTAYSPNIKERLDFSCAVFDAAGRMVAQAAHIPVHLGAMPVSVAAAINQLAFAPGDVVILNDPFQGGSHLPDITMISPIFYPQPSPASYNRSWRETGAGETAGPGELLGFVASRAHHADVGGMSPGSMPLSQELFQEGLIIPPLKLVEQGQTNEAVLKLLLANVRTPEERAGDLRAQIAANRKGIERMGEVVIRYGQAEVQQYMAGLLTYAERMTRRLIAGLPDGIYRFQDYLDGDGIEPSPLEIKVTITIKGDEAVIDFSGSAAQAKGCVNAVFAVTSAAVYYVFRALMGLDIPANSGCTVPLKIIAPPGTIVNARRPAAVAGGNVETSQRIVDTLLGALAQACPERVPAAAQGTMNNVMIGGWDSERGRPFTYYETIGGGLGGGPTRPGADAIQAHMTNTLNTPVEALEYAYPFRVRCYQIRRGSGGAGRRPGGSGIRRELELLQPAHVTLLTERRQLRPYGLLGGEPGQPGRNTLVRNGEEIELPAKTTRPLLAGDILRIDTPGGGGYGPPDR